MKLQVTVSDDLLARIDVLSKESGLSRSAFCNMLVADGVRSRETGRKLAESMPDYIREAISRCVPKDPLV